MEDEKPYSETFYIRENKRTFSSLMDLLGKKIVEESGPIKKAFTSIEWYHKNRHYENALHELLGIMMFERDLRGIKEYDEKLFNKFLMRLKTDKNPEHYFDLRFEVQITYLLISSFCMMFEKIDSPDFEIHEFDPHTFIECTTLHLVIPRNADLKEKIRDVIEDRAKKSYCNPFTALFIDITNLSRYGLQNKDSFDSDELITHVKTILERTNFGNICLFFHRVQTIPPPTRLTQYVRIDSSKITPSLFEILNKYFPESTKVVSN